MITSDHDRLHFTFPEVHDEARCSMEFQRTLRIPGDGDAYPLPPGLGAFPLRHLDDYAGRLPEEWHRRGGVIMPMHQAEAMWINFVPGLGESSAYPFAVKVATGKRCALTGEAWVEHLNRDPQDYGVLPEQPWLDGYCVERGVIRQFVAMPLGEGYTVEEQLTGDARCGGLQIIVFPMKARHYEALMAARRVTREYLPMAVAEEPMLASMGLAAGGRMKQEIYDDSYGLEVWDQRHARRCFVSIVNSRQWMAITGTWPPTEPPTARQYSERGLPWFDYYGGDAQAVAGAEPLATVKSVAQIDEARGAPPPPEAKSVAVPRTVSLWKDGPIRVRETRS